MAVKDLLNNEDLLNDIVEDLDDFPEDASVTYEVWAIGHDEDGNSTDAEMLLGICDDPDFAVAYAKGITLADVVNLAADDNYEGFATQVHTISVEVETVVPDDCGGTMNIGTIYKKTLEIYEELPEFITLSNNEFEILEDGNIQIPCSILKDYNKNDQITVVFADAEFSEPMTYKIISKTTSNHYICEFV